MLIPVPESEFQKSIYLVALMAVLLTLVACMGQAKVEAGLPEETTGYPSYRGGSIILSPDLSGIPFDPTLLTNFLNRYQIPIGCSQPSAENPLIFKAGNRSDAAGYVEGVIGGPSVIHLTQSMRGASSPLRPVVHEIHHALCTQGVAPDAVMNGWSESQRNFHPTDERYLPLQSNIRVIEQRGFYLRVEVDGKSNILTGMEEMAASLFMIDELNEFEPGYGTLPGNYKDLFKMTHEYMTVTCGNSITYEEMVASMKTGFEEGRGKSDGYTIVFSHLEKLIQDKGLPLSENFRSDYIQYLYAWELLKDETTSTHPKQKSTVTESNTVRNYRTAVNGLLTMISDPIASQHYNNILYAQNRHTRRAAIAEARRFLRQQA